MNTYYNNIRYIVMVVVCLWSWQTVIAQNETTRSYTTEHPLIYEDAWDLWPYVFLNENGEPDGYNIDLLKLIFKELDIPYVIKLKPTLEAQADLKSGKSDLMLRMDAEYSRENSFYSKNIVQLFTHSIVIPKDQSIQIRQGKDLKNQRVIVHGGSFSHYYLMKQGWAKEIAPYDDMKAAIQDAMTHGNGIILWNTMSLKWLMRKYHTDKLALVPIDMPYGEYKFMSLDHQLLERIDSAYVALRAAEKLQPIQNKWFYPDRQDTGIPVWVWYLAAFLGIAAFFLLLYYIVYRARERRLTLAVRKSNTRLSQILKTSHVSLWTYNIMTRQFTWIDEQGKAQQNTTLDAFVYRYRSKDVQRLQQAIEAISQEKEDHVNLDIQMFENNEEREAHNYTLALSVLRHDKNGHPITILCTRSDVTKELLRQMKAKKTLLRYQAIFNSVMVDMVAYDAQGYIVDINQKALSALGMDLQVIKDKKISIKEVVGDPNLDVEHFEHMYVTQIYKGEDTRPLHKMLKRDKLYYELQLTSVRDAQGKLLAIFGTGRNVTEIAESYQRLLQDIKELQKANDEVSDYIKNIDYVLKVGGIKMVKYDLTTHTLTLFSEANNARLLLTQTRMLNLIDPKWKKVTERTLNNMDNKSATSVQLDVRTTIRRQGTPLHLQFHFIPFYNDKGELKEYFGMCRDISELKVIEEKLAQETLRAQEVEVVKNAFLHNMSFEIRTPLTTVVGFAELFQMDHSTEDEAVFIREIKSNSAQLLKLINDILFLSRLDAEMITINTQPADFATGITARCESTWANNKKPEVEYIVKTPFKKLVLDIDMNHIGMVLEKILTNAVEHTTQGTVLVHYDYLGDQLAVSVEDTGRGIPEDQIKHIFDRFVTDASSNGAGLGLSICQELIQHMGGKINLTSTVGRGTNVWFTIPCKLIEMERN